MIKKNNQTIDKIYKGTTEIAKVYRGSTLVYENYKDMIATGNDIINITKAKAGSLNYLKAFGKCEQTGTPTPIAPIPIYCNNGEVIFNSILADRLPLGYTELTYIRSDGRCFIDTDIVIKEGDEIEMDWEWRGFRSDNLSDSFLFGSGAVKSTGLWVEVYKGNSPNWYVRFASSKSSNTLAPANQRIGHLVLRQSEFISNETVVLKPEYTGVLPSTTLGIFNRRNINGQLLNMGSKIEVSSFTIKDSMGEYRYQGVPCREDKTGELGLFDLVSWTFQKNTGSGKFTAGEEVYTDSQPPIYINGTKEKITIKNNNDVIIASANVSDIFAVDTYKDIQNLITGDITRQAETKILTGAEKWEQGGLGIMRLSLSDINKKPTAPLCTHFIGTKADTMLSNTIKTGDGLEGCILINMPEIENVEEFRDYLKQQYINGTPVIIVYPLATPTTETVTPQPMNIQKGTNIIEVTEASLDDLELEVKYKGK